MAGAIGFHCGVWGDAQPLQKSGTLGIPFFSKISLRAIADRIELMGYKVEVHLIEKIATGSAAYPVAKAA